MGSMEQSKSSTKSAGVDVGKHQLDAAVHGHTDRLQSGAGETDLAQLVVWMRERGVTRVGLEATGGYERPVRAALEAAGLEVRAWRWWSISRSRCGCLHGSSACGPRPTGSMRR
jgi:transposase